jgi:hypothetical protein
MSEYGMDSEKLQYFRKLLTERLDALLHEAEKRVLAISRTRRLWKVTKASSFACETGSES